MINELAAVGHFIHRCAILPGCCLQCSCNVQLLNKEIGNWARIHVCTGDTKTYRVCFESKCENKYSTCTVEKKSKVQQYTYTCRGYPAAVPVYITMVTTIVIYLYTCVYTHMYMIHTYIHMYVVIINPIDYCFLLSQFQIAVHQNQNYFCRSNKTKQKPRQSLQ